LHSFVFSRQLYELVTTFKPIQRYHISYRSQLKYLRCNYSAAVNRANSPSLGPHWYYVIQYLERTSSPVKRPGATQFTHTV